MRARRPRDARRNSAPCRWLLVGGFVTVLAVGAYFGTIVYRTASAYPGLKAGEKWTRGLFEADPDLGFRLAAGTNGAEALRTGRPVAVRVDERGFRVPVDPWVRTVDDAADRSAISPANGQLVLALGDSFTFGQACLAEASYPFLVARALRAECRNAACPSYGLAQMLILARRLIPALRPSIVLFQHSPWLAGRSQRDTAMTLLRGVPTPYFEVKSESILLRLPRFPTILFDLPVETHRDSPRGAWDFLSFLARVGAPLLVHDDGRRCIAWMKYGRMDAPGEDALEAFVHAEVADLCARSGSLLVFVEIGKSCAPIEIEAAARGPSRLVVDARAALCDALPGGDREAYYRRYAHFAGDPPVLEDGHPNELAHALIADAIVRAIEEARR